jgi:hypothetical protein
MRSRRLILAGAATALIAAPAAWYYGSPWWTLWRMREAARERDLTTLATYVDTAAIRAQAERELKTLWTSAIAEVRTDTPDGRRFVDLARRKLSERPAIGLMDLRPWLESIPIGIAVLGGGESGPRPYIVRRGFDSFEVRDEGASLEHGPVLTFRREGLGWKLERVRWGQQ